MLNHIRTYRLLALSLAFLVASTTTGFTMSFHYCQGALKSVSVFCKPHNCHEVIKSCCAKKGQKTQAVCKPKKDGKCCDDKTEWLQADSDLIPAFTGDFQDLQWDATTTTIPTYHTSGINKEQSYFPLYRPPPLIRDVQVLFCTFLL